ncbi:hypothetical protein C1M55_24335 [Rhodococcus qingshengii]|nr:hypothetical protein C1M55_24335 [Rhodococcus qingshengii]
MGMTCPATTANAVVTSIANLGTRFALHTGNPGPAGTSNEASGAGYQRQDATFAPAAGGITSTGQMTFLVPANTFTHMTRWNGTTYIETIDNPDIVISPQGEAKVTYKITFPFTIPT